MKNKLAIEVEYGSDAIDALRIEWRRLFQGAEASPFLSWEWVSTWNRWFGQNDPCIIKTYSGKRLVGILPLCKGQRKLFGIKVDRLGLMGETDGGADYLDVIAAPADRGSVLATSFAYLLNGDVRVDRLDLANISMSSETVAFLGQSMKDYSRISYFERPSYKCPQVDLKDGW